MDELIARFDRALRAVSGVVEAARAFPSEPIAEGELSEADKRHSGALMRVNHVGEVCAQALYEGQALVARDEATRASLESAAQEERDHLAWCNRRIEELGGRPSLLTPLWYAGSFALGAGTGIFGDRWNLAFLAETERQVEQHLSGHLKALSPKDGRTRALVEAMREDEARHRNTAIRLGAAELPQPVKAAMRLASAFMTTVAHRV